MTAPLALEPQGEGWRLILSGDWSLAAMPSVETQLKSLPATLHGNLVCDWTQAQTPGISPAWALLRRLAQAAPPLDVSHTGNPPHFLELLQKLHVDRHAAYSVQAPEPTLERLVGKLVLENEFLKGASRDALRPRSETMSVIAGPVVSRSPKDAG